MVNQLTYSNTVFETIGVIYTTSLSDRIWEKYKKFAIAKIIESTLKLRGSFYYLKHLTPHQAKKELESLDKLMPIIAKIKSIVESIDDKDFKDIRMVITDFFEAIDQLYEGLLDVADVYLPYKASMPILSNDWDSEEDQHWDNY